MRMSHYAMLFWSPVSIWGGKQASFLARRRLGGRQKENVENRIWKQLGMSESHERIPAIRYVSILITFCKLAGGLFVLRIVKEVRGTISLVEAT